MLSLNLQVKQLKFEKGTIQETMKIISAANSERFLKLQKEFEEIRAHDELNYRQMRQTTIDTHKQFVKNLQESQEEKT